MQLLLVRHAKAFERDAAAWPDDLRRPLTADGREEFERLARRLGAAMTNVAYVFASPATRAWQTARLLHEHARWPLPEKCDALLPDEPAVVHRAERLFPKDPPGVVVWVGHEPNLSQTASWLLTADPARLSIDFKKGAAMLLELDMDAANSPAGRARLHWLVTPRIARRRKR
ncbi:MAG: histidine phosphatase family protein [Phycisphaerales bacterium]